MKKKLLNGKRIMTLLLALSLVMGETGVVWATPAAEEEQTEVSVSANEVSEVDEAVTTDDSEQPDEEMANDEGKKPEAEDVTQETAYDGTVSKVIGLDGEWSCESYFTGANGEVYRFVYTNPRKNQYIYVSGKPETYKVAGTESALYFFAGRYYTSAWYSESSKQTCLSSPITFLTAAMKEDPATGLYKLADGYVNYTGTITINGQTRYYVSDTRYDVVGTYASYDEMTAAIEKAGVKGDDGYTIYYSINGKYYLNLNSWNYSMNTAGKYILYASKGDEISFSAQYVKLTWNELTTDNVYIADNKEIQIGYQIEENGKLVESDIKSSDGKTSFQTSGECTRKTALLPGQVMTYRVRGLYYTYDEATSVCKIIKVGEWSDKYTYVAPKLTKLPAVTGFRQEAKTDDDGDAYVVLSWTDILQADYYNYEVIYSNVALKGLTTENWDGIIEGNEKRAAFEAANPNADWSFGGTTSTGSNEARFAKSDTEDQYIYVRVRATGSEINGYIEGDYSAIQTIVLKKKAVSNVPVVQNFRVEYTNNDNGFKLAWNPVKADMIIFAVEKAKGFPQWYTYNVLNARAKDAAGNRYLSDALDAATKKKIYKEVDWAYVDGINGSITDSNFSLKPGVEYSFVAYTYDKTFDDVEKSPIVYNGVKYTYYTAMSSASAIVSAKIGLDKPTVNIASGADSLKFTMSGSRATGFEIYKKTGKKYKKLTITTDNIYVDENLKKNSKYNYKVRSYYYNKYSKKKAYSDWVFVTGETSDVVKFDLDVTKKTKTSVTLKWLKVKGATKYEVYRTNITSRDPSIISKKNSVDSEYKYMQAVDKYELIKTLKGSATKYVDKKLINGDAYLYVVKAYYKNGKSTMYVSASDSVNLYLETPILRGTLKGSSAKLSWDKDKFATKYEIRYKIYDAKGKVINTKAAADEYTYVSTKKTSYTVKGIPVGGYVYAQIRAYGNKKYTSFEADSAWIEVGKNLAVTKSIKASNVVVKKSDGAKVNAVKITWKAVKGAKYYKVYRSTQQGAYDADTKRYAVVGNQLIAKESNDDELFYDVYYDEYLGIKGSIVGTTAYDYAQLDTGVKYYYYVVAFGEKNTNVCSELSETSFGMASGKPASVTYQGTVSPSLKSKKGTATISWVKIPGATKYYVYRSTKKGSGYKLVGTTKKPKFTDKKVTKGKTYYYKIEARGVNALKANFSTMSTAKKIKVKK